jgi:transposase InsO family protein
MAWHSIDEAIIRLQSSKRHIYRLVEKKKIQSQSTNEGTQVWLDDCDSIQSCTVKGEPRTNPLAIPVVPSSKITASIVKKVDAMMQSCFPKDGIVGTEQRIEREVGIPAGTQRRYKLALRNLFGLSQHSPLQILLSHPQIRQALEYIIVRKEYANKGTLTRAQNLGVVVPVTGELITVEEFLKSLYARENSNAVKCCRALHARCLKKQVLNEEGLPVSTDKLPSDRSIMRFLGKWREENIAVRRGRSRKHDWEVSQEPFVTRDPEQYHPGELWIGDHTELDVVIIDENGKLDHRWVTAFIDMRTRLMVGYHLSWQPSSNTIALAFRDGVLGSQIKANVNGDHFEKINLQNMPEQILIDNGKDYRSKYTQQIFGKIDFVDMARLSIQRMTQLHYATEYHAQSKAEIERWFKTITYSVLNCLPGYKGNKYQNKPDSLQREIKAGEIMTAETFDTIFAIAVNAYNNRVHRSLKGQTPLQYYLTNLTHQRTIDIRVLDFLMMKVSNRVIRRSQITLMGNEYYSEALMAFNGKRAEIYYDPMDVGLISIYADGEFAAVACNKEMIGQDEHGWLRILHDRKKNEKSMQENLKIYRKGISDRDAKLMMLEGELLNMQPVSKELLQKQTAHVTLLTGIEKKAIEQKEHLEKQEQVVEIEKRAKKRAKQMLITPEMIGRVS